MDDLDFRTINDPDYYLIDNPDLHTSNNPGFHIIDDIETIYEEDLESFENTSVLVSSDDERQDDVANDLNEDTTTYFTKELASKIVYHTLTPIEYPETSLEGVAYVYNVEGWDEPLAAFKDIQYSIGKPGGEYKVMCSYLGVEVKCEIQTCQGSKLCEFAANELHNQAHQCVNINSNLIM
ncbi:324_t:CDS:2 [Cetraspora pellucida]|uniref:324_t:CDS:1 n=1 Tax=Cetraspora pellucida TaxID=1433469 RepID=A0A9N9E6W4_9GLOM|nr:324_t:CDS:2 [Cetraspora pellucida]